jgi:hypothetical protein
MRIFRTTERYAAPMNREKREIYTQRSANHHMRAVRSEAHSRQRRCTKTEVALRYAQSAGPTEPPRTQQGPHTES